jgi:hypothetical protein
LIKFKVKIILFTILTLFYGRAYSQPEIDDIELNQKQWEALRDLYAVEAIKLLAKLDTLNYQIDSLKQLRDIAVNYDCEEELYKIAGVTKQHVADFRKKFEETEKKITGKLGSPDELRSHYFDEIKRSNIKCLPEFSERYIAMSNYMNAITMKIDSNTELPADSYTVAKGDCLWKISQHRYNTPYLWPAIWDANRISIVNPGYFPEAEKKKISDPNLVYPGQVLKIPLMKKEDIQKVSNRRKKLKRIRKDN